MPSNIVDIQNIGDALRNTGYKSIDCAAAEIVDNSLEAGAKNVFIILSETYNSGTGRNNVSEIAFLDDGIGMSTETLGRCLGLGSTTRQERRGMGRFGVGLPQASLFACPQVEVYSWQNGIENCQKVYLDINKVKSGEQVDIPDPVKVNFPEKYDFFLYKTDCFGDIYDFKKSGTLVVWKKCDNVKPKMLSTLDTALKECLGRKFRHFIHDKKSRLFILDANNRDYFSEVKPNDPLFLMEDNVFLANSLDIGKKAEQHDIRRKNAEPIFEPFDCEELNNGEYVKDICFTDKNGNKRIEPVKVIFSKVKGKFYDADAFPTTNPGNTPIGKYVKELEGISIVRAGREIDFGRFDFYENVNEPTHRWWGCEIQFTPALDEVFGVANNKQYVDLKQVGGARDYFGDDPYTVPVWKQLNMIIQSTISKMVQANKILRKSTRNGGDSSTLNNATINIVTAVDGESSNHGDLQVISPTDIDKGEGILITDGVSEPTPNDLTFFFKNKIHFSYVSLGPRSLPFDYETICETTTIKINMDHPFYTNFLKEIYENSSEVKITFELFIASIIRSIIELDSFEKNRSANDDLIRLWYRKLEDYIETQLHPK